MRLFEDIKEDYRLGPKDQEILLAVWGELAPQADQVVEHFYQRLLDQPDTAKFLEDPEILARLKRSHRAWLESVFLGPFDERYYQRLKRIGNAHVRIGLSAHFVYVGMNFIREELKNLVAALLDPHRQRPALEAIDKILDLNLDVIARAYHEESMRRVFLSYKFDDFLIRFARRFTFGLNLILLVGLVALAVGMVYVLVIDVSQIFRGQLEKGLVAALGSLLIMWLAIELLEGEMERLQGGALPLSLFVGVALVAFLRKILIATITHESLEVELLYLGGILVLGLVYWLIRRAETVRSK
jgi:uncharacterized membrane protein (DUF373 family)